MFRECSTDCVPAQSISKLVSPIHMLLVPGAGGQDPLGAASGQARAQEVSWAEGTADPNVYPHTLLHVSPGPLQCYLQVGGWKE